MNKIWITLLIAALPLCTEAQQRNAAKQQQATYSTLPAWATAHNYNATAHVYFPDYYTFYDAKRGGYVFWEKGKWTFSPALPPFLEKVDMSKTRIKILKDLSLDLQPELNYPYYMKLYPPDDNGNTLVPVPIPGNPAAR